MTSEYSLEFVEYSQAYDLLAIAVTVGGPESGFPAVLGVSIRNRKTGIIDLDSQRLEKPGTLVCLIESPEKLADPDAHSGYPHYEGEITFALWSDSSYRTELARISWKRWAYSDLGSLDPSRRVDPITAASIEDRFEAMKARHGDRPRWIARPVRA